MQPQRIAVVHPGAMGAAIARAIAGNDHHVGWCRTGRSPQTSKRARGLQAFDELSDLAAWARAVISVVPPHAAVEMARAVLGCGFAGVYVDANAIAPTTARQIQQLVEDAGCLYVDGGIIGPPPTTPAGSRLYLARGSAARQAASDIAALFEGSTFEAPVLDDSLGPTAASALKMVYAAWTKGGAALLLATARAAEALGVMAALEQEWQRSLPETPARLERTKGAAGPKAWRYVGEMLEIARAFEDAGQTGGFHRAAAEVYEQLAAAHRHRAGGPREAGPEA